MARKKKDPIIEPEQIKQIKSIFTSKTFWVNFLAIIAFAIQKQYGFIIDEATQAQALMLINIILRSITKEEVKWK